MKTATRKLLSLASESLVAADPVSRALEAGGSLGRELLELLSVKNGFYAFEGALHVFPAGGEGVCDVDTWNEASRWRNRYPELPDGLIFFAEDAFGGQFGIDEMGVYFFGPETGELDKVAGTVEEWAAVLLLDYRSLTGYPLAHEWQETHGALEAGSRLVPKTPFVLGGRFDVANLFALESVRAMRTYANLASQIRGLPDGTQVTLRVVD